MLSILKAFNNCNINTLKQISVQLWTDLVLRAVVLPIYFPEIFSNPLKNVELWVNKKLIIKMHGPEEKEIRPSE